jgi:gliding motility-associated-like protein
VGSYQTNAGVYDDLLSTVNGCDSITSTTVTLIPVVTTALTWSICPGDSVLLGGAYQTSAGAYNDTLSTVIGCDSILVTTLTIVPQSSITVDPPLSICLGDPTDIAAIGSGAGTVTWYSDAAGSVVLGTGTNHAPSITAPGTYVYYVSEVGTCPSPIDSVTIIVGGVSAIINATPITGIMPLNVFFGNGSTTGAGISYVWDFGDGDTSTAFEPTHIYLDQGVYDAMLVVTDGLCSDTAWINITVDGESHLLVPNVFTPNGDGINDLFGVHGANLVSATGAVYNRWGQMVHSWVGVEGSWDGRTSSGNIAVHGTYYYIISAEGADGVEYLEKGHVTLLR